MCSSRPLPGPRSGPGPVRGEGRPPLRTSGPLARRSRGPEWHAQQHLRNDSPPLWHTAGAAAIGPPSGLVDAGYCPYDLWPIEAVKAHRGRGSMLRIEDNERLTQIRPGTAHGRADAPSLAPRRPAAGRQALTPSWPRATAPWRTLPTERVHSPPPTEAARRR